MKTVLKRAVGAATLFVMSLSVHATATVTHYTSRYLNSFGYYQTADSASNPWGTVTDFTGAPVSYGYEVSSEMSYANGAGGGFSHIETDAGFASADLSSGQLKARAYIALGNAISGMNLGTYGLDYADNSAEASFGDSLSFASGKTPYIWRTGDTFTFNMKVDGKTEIPADMPKTPLATQANLWLSVYRPGGLQAVQNASDFDFSAYSVAHGFDAAIAEFLRLIDLISSFRMSSKAWCLGDTTAPLLCDGLPVNLDDGGSVSYTFSPGGDFEFSLLLRTTATIDSAYEGYAVDMDFSHTVTAGFTAPSGVTVYSASGVFPNTLELGAPTTVPEPEGITLITAGLGMLTWMRRKEKS